MKKTNFKSTELSFDALYDRQDATRVVLFAVGSGGNPERHLPILESLSSSGFTVIAPYFERIVSPFPSLNELGIRSSILSAAANLVEDRNAQLVGVGHSIGATLLLGLVGGKIWMNEHEAVPSGFEDRIKRLALFAPPTGFFQAPNSLNKITASIQVWFGTMDTVTPPQQIEVLKKGLSKTVSFEGKLVDGATHFSFMNTLPPTITDEMKDRMAFLSRLENEVTRFVSRK